MKLARCALPRDLNGVEIVHTPNKISDTPARIICESGLSDPKLCGPGFFINVQAEIGWVRARRNVGRARESDRDL